MSAKLFNIVKKLIFPVIMLIMIAGPSGECQGQQSSASGAMRFSGTGDRIAEVQENVADQLYLYKEVMEHIATISESFSNGFTTSDEALKRVLVLRHAYNSKSESLCPEVEEFHRLMNRMFSRLENYFMRFNRFHREDPYINMKLAEKKFYVNQEAERLEYMYLR